MHEFTTAPRSIETIAAMVHFHIASGWPAMVIVGRALPPKRITVNLALADLLKEGVHFDLPIAFGLLGNAVACIGWVIAFNRIPCQRRNINA